MAPNKLINWLLEKPLSIDPAKAGKTLLGINAVGIGAAGISNTFAAAIDKNTSAEDKKFLIPAGFGTCVANLGLYFALTIQLIDRLQGATKYNKDGSVKKVIKGFADHVLEAMDENTFNQGAIKYTDKAIKKAQTGFMGTGLFKKPREYVDSMIATLKTQDGNITDAAKELYKTNFKSGFGVLGAFIGAVIGSAILTPIFRDVSAYAIQKIREKNNPDLKNEPHHLYFDPIHINGATQIKPKQITMKNYMAYTSNGMKI